MGKMIHQGLYPYQNFEQPMQMDSIMGFMSQNPIMQSPSSMGENIGELPNMDGAADEGQEFARQAAMFQDANQRNQMDINDQQSREALSKLLELISNNQPSSPAMANSSQIGYQPRTLGSLY